METKATPNRSIADYLWDKAQSTLSNESFDQWLCFVYGATKDGFSRIAIKVINKQIEALALVEKAKASLSSNKGEEK